MHRPFANQSNHLQGANWEPLWHLNRVVSNCPKKRRDMNLENRKNKWIQQWHGLPSLWKYFENVKNWKWNENELWQYVTVPFLIPIGVHLQCEVSLVCSFVSLDRWNLQMHHPKNHGISKLVRTGDPKEPCYYTESFNPFFRRVQSLILRALKIQFTIQRCSPVVAQEFQVFVNHSSFILTRWKDVDECTM